MEGDGSSGIVSPFKGKTYIEIYGEEKAIELKKIRQDKLIGNNYGTKTKGKKLSEKQKNNLSDKKSIPVKQLDKNFNVIKIWNKCKEAADFLEISISGIHNVLNENMPAKSAGGYFWEYINKENKKYNGKTAHT